MEELQSPKISLPFQVLLEGDSEQEEGLTIRCMTPQDLSYVLPMCIDEFGTGPTTGLQDFPWQDLRLLPNWWDRVYFEPSIALFVRAKMNANLGQEPKQGFEDPALLVLCRQQDQTEIVVGMVELSLQPPEANRNPSAFPIPVWIKTFYCQLTGQTMQGWVTNLLIDPKYRGLGYSKILMAATEGIARSWDRNAIYLHSDADFKSGKIPQALYKDLGYEVVTDDDQFAWMGDGFNPFSSIRMIEGVPLLCFRKRL
jgi:GNAT superfamily N-acetyltransferase